MFVKSRVAAHGFAPVHRDSVRKRKLQCYATPKISSLDESAAAGGCWLVNRIVWNPRHAQNQQPGWICYWINCKAAFTMSLGNISNRKASEVPCKSSLSIDKIQCLTRSGTNTRTEDEIVTDPPVTAEGLRAQLSSAAAPTASYKVYVFNTEGGVVAKSAPAQAEDLRSTLLKLSQTGIYCYFQQKCTNAVPKRDNVSGLSRE